MSLRLLALGFVCGSALGLMFGVLMGLSDLAAALFAPLFNAIRQIPSIAFIPLLILILGIDDTFKVFVVAKAAFFPVALAAYDAVRGVTRSYFEVAALYRLPLRLLIGRIVVPATTPAVITRASARPRTLLGRVGRRGAIRLGGRHRTNDGDGTAAVSNRCGDGGRARDRRPWSHVRIGLFCC